MRIFKIFRYKNQFSQNMAENKGKCLIKIFILFPIQKTWLIKKFKIAVLFYTTLRKQIVDSYVVYCTHDLVSVSGPRWVYYLFSFYCRKQGSVVSFDNHIIPSTPDSYQFMIHRQNVSVKNAEGMKRRRIKRRKKNAERKNAECDITSNGKIAD
jgi:hypothetical protein